MGNARQCGWILCALAGLGLAAPGRAGAQSRIERSGTIGVAFFGGYGIVTGDSRIGTDFDDGGSLGLALRYVLGSHWSMALTFLSQTYDGTSASGLDKAVMTGGQLDVHYYRDRALSASQYLVLGVGFYRPEIHRSNGDVSFPGENLMVSGGLGAEVFIGESWGIDLTGRAYGYIGDGISTEEENEVASTGDFSVGFQGTVGLFFYLLR